MQILWFYEISIYFTKGCCIIMGVRDHALLGSARLISADGTVLDPALPLNRTSLQSGDTVTAVALPPAKLLALD